MMRRRKHASFGRVTALLAMSSIPSVVALGCQQGAAPAHPKRNDPIQAASAVPAASSPAGSSSEEKAPVGASSGNVTAGGVAPGPQTAPRSSVEASPQPRPFAELRALPPSPPVPAGCAGPMVLAATAPGKMADDATGWFWPWVGQALLANSQYFHLVESLDSPGSERDVLGEEVRLPKNALGMVLRCRTKETCVEVARVLRASVPKSQASLVCSAPGAPTGRSLAGRTRVPEVASPEQRGTAGCARLAACTKEQSPEADVDSYLACQTKPAGFPLSCASLSTCYDVVKCASPGKESVLQFDPFADVTEEFGTRTTRLQAERASHVVPGASGGDSAYAVEDDGGGGMALGDLDQFFQEPVSPSGPEVHGYWVTVGTGMTTGGTTNSGSGAAAQGQQTWRVGVLTPSGRVVLGAEKLCSANEWSTHNCPALMNPAQPALAFDFDGDGRRELLLPVFDGAHANSGVRRLEIWQYDGHEIRRYPGTEGLPVVGYADPDGDGRPDLILDEVNGFEEDPPQVHSSFYSEKWKLAHSLPNGSFSRSDAVARGYHAGDGD